MGDALKTVAFLNCKAGFVAKRQELRCMFAVQKFAIGKDGRATVASRIKPVTKWDLQKKVTHHNASPVDCDLRVVMA